MKTLKILPSFSRLPSVRKENTSKSFIRCSKTDDVLIFRPPCHWKLVEKRGFHKYLNFLEIFIHNGRTLSKKMSN